MTPSIRRLLLGGGSTQGLGFFSLGVAATWRRGLGFWGEVEKEQNMETSLGMGFGAYGILGWWGRKNSEASMGCKVFFAGFWRGEHGMGNQMPKETDS